MKRFHKEKIEISNYLDSIAIQAYRKGVLRIYDILFELTKIVPQTMKKA